MMQQFAGFARAVTNRARRQLLVVLALCVSGAIALGFGTAAAYMAIAQAAGHIYAAAAVAAFYAVTASIIALVGRPDGPQSEQHTLAAAPQPEMSNADAIGQLVAAFVTGFQATRRRRD